MEGAPAERVIRTRPAAEQKQQEPIETSDLTCGISRPTLEGRTQGVFRRTLANSSVITKQTHGTGHRVPPLTRPPLINRETALTNNWRAPEDQHLHTKWMQLAKLGQAMITTDNSPGFHSNSFLIPKKQKGEHRSISDSRKFNRYVRHQHRKIPTLTHASPNLTLGAWLSSFDVMDGCFNVPIHRDDQLHFRFNVGNTTHQLTRSPMGHVGSMTAFRAWLQPCTETIRACCPEVNIFTYVDDALVMLPANFTQAMRSLRRVREVATALRLPLKKQKSDWCLSRTLEHLGFVIDANKMTMAVPPKKAKSVSHQVKKTLRQANKGTLRVRHLASTIGQLLAPPPAIKHARLHARNLCDAQTRAMKSQGWTGNRPVGLNHETRAEPLWWLEHLRALRRCPMDHHRHCKDVTIIATDAADNRIAGVLTSDPVLPHWSRQLTRSEKRLTTSVKEPLAVVESIGKFQDLHGGLSNFRVDNQVVVAAMNRWGSTQRALIPLLTHLHSWSMRTNTRITATHVHTTGNTFADGPSRDRIPTKRDRTEANLLAQGAKATRTGVTWRLSKAHRRALFEAFRMRPRSSLRGPLSFEDNPLPKGFLPMADSKTSGSTFCFPNLQQTQQNLLLMKRLRIDTLVLSPLWPGAPWCNQAAHLACSRPVVPPPNAVRPLHQRVKSWPGWAWIGVKLSGNRKRRTQFRQQLRSTPALLRPLRRDAPQVGGAHAGTWGERASACVHRFMEIARRAKF